MSEIVKIPSDLKMEDLGHIPDKAAGFCVNYTRNDVLNSSYEKSCTVFGHEVYKKEAVILIHKLIDFLNNCAQGKYDYLNKGN